MQEFAKTSDLAAVAARCLPHGAAEGRDPRSPCSRPFEYDQAAQAAALGDGLLSEEIDQVLAGRRMIEAFPVRCGESLRAYAARAVSETMVAYLHRAPGCAPA